MTANAPASALEAVANAICAARGFAFVRYVGAGVFKETFEVTHAGMPYALKVYNARNNPQRAAREIDAMERCTHAHIAKLATIDDFENPSGRYFFSVEEYLGGGTLSERLTAGRLTPKEVYALGVALIGAVAHIADLDLVHRDLKPDNIMFRVDGVTPVVVDFGLVRDLSAQSLTQTHFMQGPGTPLFAPAEQLVNHKGMIDWRADQFSLGIVLSYCAFGLHPYQQSGDGPIGIVERVTERADPASRFSHMAQAAGLPALLKMVAPWPVQRYRTPDALASAWAAQQPADNAPETGPLLKED